MNTSNDYEYVETALDLAGIRTLYPYSTGQLSSIAKRNPRPWQTLRNVHPQTDPSERSD